MGCVKAGHAGCVWMVPLIQPTWSLDILCMGFYAALRNTILLHSLSLCTESRVGRICRSVYDLRRRSTSCTNKTKLEIKTTRHFSDLRFKASRRFGPDNVYRAKAQQTRTQIIFMRKIEKWRTFESQVSFSWHSGLNYSRCLIYQFAGPGSYYAAPVQSLCFRSLTLSLSHSLSAPTHSFSCGARCWWWCCYC